MHIENPAHPDALINAPFFERSPAGSVMLQVRGSRHGSFGDPAIWQLSRSRPGPIEGRRMIEILRDYVRAFLDVHFKGVSSNLVAGPKTAFSEVRVQAKSDATRGGDV